MNDWTFFTRKELECRGTGDCAMNLEFMDKLVNLQKDIIDQWLLVQDIEV